jgi:TadE-like protein
MERQRAQASIETVALLPALLLLGLGCWQALLVGWTSICAEHAARAAARAEMVGAPPRRAALAALPGVMHGGLRIDASPHVLRVRVAVPQLIPGFDMALTADAPVVRQ